MCVCVCIVPACLMTDTHCNTVTMVSEDVGIDERGDCIQALLHRELDRVWGNVLQCKHTHHNQSSSLALSHIHTD